MVNLRSFSLTLEARAGAHVNAVCESAQHIADVLLLDVCFKFNGVQALASPHGDAAKMAEEIMELVADNPQRRLATSQVRPL